MLEKDFKYFVIELSTVSDYLADVKSKKAGDVSEGASRSAFNLLLSNTASRYLENTNEAGQVMLAFLKLVEKKVGGASSFRFAAAGLTNKMVNPETKVGGALLGACTNEAHNYELGLGEYQAFARVINTLPDNQEKQLACRTLTANISKFSKINPDLLNGIHLDLLGLHKNGTTKKKLVSIYCQDPAVEMAYLNAASGYAEVNPEDALNGVLGIYNNADDPKRQNLALSIFNKLAKSYLERSPENACTYLHDILRDEKIAQRKNSESEKITLRRPGKLSLSTMETTLSRLLYEGDTHCAEELKRESDAFDIRHSKAIRVMRELKTQITIAQL